MQWNLSLAALLTASIHPVWSFNMYPAVDTSKLAEVFNLTTDCVTALNTSLPECDQTLFSMAVQFDNYYWEYDNITDLCGTSCQSDANQWHWTVQDACDGQTITAYGKLLPAESISGRYLDSMNHLCLASNTLDQWCLSLSYNWTGSDVIRVDCTANPTDPSCTGDVSANTRLANLYSNDILCDNCFIDMMYQRVISPYYPDTSQLEYLSDQLQDIGDICNVTIPAITVRADPDYDVAPPATSIDILPGASSTTTSSVAATTTCSGQTVNALQRIRNIMIRQNGNCDSLSAQYGVTTGDLQYLTNSDTCTITSSICLPAKCTLTKVSGSQTCDSIAASISGNVTTTQFLVWNPHIQGLCDAPTQGQQVCISPPGGTYNLAPPPLGSANAGNQQRGGQGGVVTPTSTVTSTVNSATAGPDPSPTQSGIASNCNNYAQAKAGDDCFDFAVAHNIKPSDLYAWNLVLGANGANCSLQFQADEYYCVGVSSSVTTTTTTTKSATTTSISAPGPTQSGIVSNCNKYATPAPGTGCFDFATANSITQAQLYQWNTVLGPNGENCNTKFWANEYYCVGVSS